MINTIWYNLMIHFTNNRFWAMGNFLKILALCGVVFFIAVYILRSAPKIKCKCCNNIVQQKDLYCPNCSVEMGPENKEVVVMKDKKSIAILGFSIAVLFLLAFIGLISYGKKSGYFDNLATGVYTEKRMLFRERKNVWAMEFDAALVEGKLNKTIQSSGENLKSLKVVASSSSGTATLKIQQGELVDIIDLSNTNGEIIYDISKFKDEEISLIIEHSKLKDYYFYIEWA